MDVVVTKNCPRCGKKSVLNVDLAAAVVLEESQKNEAAAMATMDAAILGAMQACPVDAFILVAVKNPDGTYAMKSLAGICSGARSCTSKITSLVSEIFVPVKQVVKKQAAPDGAAVNEEDSDVNG